MLFNSNNQVVNVPKQYNSKEHPHVFAPLREEKIPTEKFVGSMFSLETRAKIK